MDSKWFLQTKRFHGAAVAVLGVLCSLYGADITDQQLTETVGNVAAVIGTILHLYGQFKANKPMRLRRGKK